MRPRRPLQQPKPADVAGPLAIGKITSLLSDPVLPLYLGTPGGAKTLAVTTTTIAGDVLSQNVYGGSSNGITKLYAQMLGAKIAIARGASPASISATLLAANLFLATHDFNDWSALSSSDQAQVLSWQSTFADYNSGLMGPPHC